MSADKVASKKSIYDSIWERKLKATPKGTPALLPNLTGRVLVYKDKDQCEVLEGVHFSNVDLVWYDAEGNVHPLMEKYYGRKWSMKFKIQDQDRFGKDHEFESMLLCPLGVGEMGPIDWQGIPEAEQMEAEFGIEKGAFTGYDDPYMKDYLKGAGTSFIVFGSPNKKWHEIMPFIILIAYGLIFDDMIDNNTFFPKQLNYQEICALRDRFVEVLLGEKDAEDQEIDFEFPQLKPLCRYLEYVREGILKMAATREIAERLFKDLVDYLNAVVVENAAEWLDYKAQCKTGTTQRAHYDLRKYAADCFPTWQCQLLMYGNKLPKKIHDSHLYQYLRKLGVDHFVYINDMLSYRKERNDGESCNTVYTRHHEEGMDFISALESCVRDGNNVAIDMFEVGELLKKLYNNDKYLEEAIYLLKASAMGHLHWYNYALRYHNGIVFDAVVHHESDKWEWSMDKKKAA